jgi:hypothetical protein
MSLESDVAGVLRSSPVDQIRFSIDTIAINEAELEKVAKAIDTGDILVVAGQANAGPYYQTMKTMRTKPGEDKKIGKITLGERAPKSVIGRAAIFHESIHALMDVNGVSLNRHRHEVIAYLADAMYLTASNFPSKRLGVDSQGRAIFDAAYGLVKSKKMQRIRRGAKLSWSDCSGLLNAIKAHKDYH